MTTTSRTKGLLSTLLGSGVVVSTLVLGVTVASASAHLGPSNAQRAHLAKEEATHMLKVAPLPAGAKRLATYSRAYREVLGGNANIYNDPDQATRSRYYLAPDSSYASAWLTTRTVQGHKQISKSSSSGPDTFDATSVTYAFPTTAALPNPVITYTMVTTTKGALEFRLTADVTWVPRKSTYSQLSRGAIKLVVVANRGPDVKTDKVTTVVTTKKRDIDLLIARIDALPAETPGTFACPRDAGATLTLRFYAAHRSKPYAVVVADPAGCGLVAINQFRASGTVLGKTSVVGGATFAALVAHELGIKNVTGTR